MTTKEVELEAANIKLQAENDQLKLERNATKVRDAATNQRIRKEFSEFEVHCKMVHERDNPGHVAVLMKDASYEDLRSSGFIHFHNEHRITRIARQRHASGKEEGLFDDVGADMLAKVFDGEKLVYHAVQCKFWSSNIGSGDLGTFVAVALRLKTGCYLYTTTPLTKMTMEDWQLFNAYYGYKHIQLDWSPATAEVMVTPSPSEKDFRLYPFQIEAVAHGSKEGKQMLAIYCGLGKTIITGHVMSNIAERHRVIVVTAPLMSTTEQFKDRIFDSNFLPRHVHMLVDSDSGGTTDVEKIRKAIKDADNKPLVIFITYASLENLHNVILTGDEFLIVDEVHNFVSPVRRAIFLRFANSLSLSATVTIELPGLLGTTPPFCFGIKEAIAQGYIPNYRIVIPALGSNEYKEALTTEMRAEFIITGALQFGCKKIICFLPTKESCETMKAALQLVGDPEDYEQGHGLSMWMKTVNSDVSRTIWKQTLLEFQKDCEHDLCVILSCNILSEGIDVISCDATFVSLAEDPCPVRLMQRIARSGRKDPMNPNKISTSFIIPHSNSSSNSIMTSLSMMREQDPELHTKIRVLNHSFAARDVEELVAAEAMEQQDVREFVRTAVGAGCVTDDEDWRQRLEQFLDYERIHGKVRHKSSGNPEKRHAHWWNKQVVAFNAGNMNVLRRGLMTASGRMTQDRDRAKLSNWTDFFTTHDGTTPSKLSTKVEERKLHTWQVRIRGRYRNKELAEDLIQDFDATRGWRWSLLHEQLVNWELFTATNGRIPVQTHTSRSENLLALWRIHTHRRANISEQDTALLAASQLWNDNPFISRACRRW